MADGAPDNEPRVTHLEQISRDRHGNVLKATVTAPDNPQQELHIKATCNGSPLTPDQYNDLIQKASIPAESLISSSFHETSLPQGAPIPALDAKDGAYTANRIVTADAASPATVTLSDQIVYVGEAFDIQCPTQSAALPPAAKGQTP